MPSSNVYIVRFGDVGDYVLEAFASRDLAVARLTAMIKARRDDGVDVTRPELMITVTETTTKSTSWSSAPPTLPITPAMPLRPCFLSLRDRPETRRTTWIDAE